MNTTRTRPAPPTRERVPERDALLGRREKVRMAAALLAVTFLAGLQTACFAAAGWWLLVPLCVPVTVKLAGDVLGPWVLRD